MRVKVNDTWYDSDDQPICIQINTVEQQQIADMDRRVASQGKYAVFPDSDSTTAKQKIDWMKD